MARNRSTPPHSAASIGLRGFLLAAFGVPCVLPQGFVAPPDTLATLIAGSSLIVIGRPSISAADLNYANPANDSEAEATMNIEAVLKGGAMAANIHVVLPATTGRESLLRMGRVIAFLEPDSIGHDAFRAISSTFGYEPVAKFASVPAANLRETISSILINSAEDTATPRSDRIRLTHLIASEKSEAATHALKLLATDPDPSIRLRAVGPLIAQGDPLALESAVSELRSSTTLSIDQQNLFFPIESDLSQQEARLDLLLLAKAPDSWLRARATLDLNKTNLAFARPTLASALTDGDVSVRYAAVTALATLAHQPAWGPLRISQFKLQEAMYIRFWQEWLAEN